MGYEFKVGNKGKTRLGHDYEVIAIVPDSGTLVTTVIGPNGNKEVCVALKDGTKYTSEISVASDLMPPEPESRDCYLWVGPHDMFALVNGMIAVDRMDLSYGPTKAIKSLTIKDGEGLKLLETWRDERAKKAAAPEPLWPGRVVYDLGCVTDAKHIDACLKDGRMLHPCGFQWRKTPQGNDWWWSQRYDKPLSSETRAALEDLLAQYKFENGERYEVDGGLVANREEIIKAIGGKYGLFHAFDWEATPEGYKYWDRIYRTGHDWQSRVKLKVMLLSIAAHDAASSDRDTLEVSQ